MVKRELNNRGFTFVELVIAVAILSIITVSIASFMATTSRVYSKTESNEKVQSQAVEVYDQISNCIMQANKVILYGYKFKSTDTDGSKIYDTTGYYFISDNLDDVTGYETSTGSLVDSKNNYYKIIISQIEENGGSNSETAVPKAFKSLKTVDSTTNDSVITEVLVKALYMEYQTKVNGTDYETCYATFYISDGGDLYLNRHYDSDSDISGYVPGDASTALAVLDMNVSESSVLCKTIEDNDFSVMVDAENNSIGLVLNFNNNSMTYDTLGMIKIRNSSVLTR